jgi:predicted Zn-dependent peptidase
MKSISQKVIMVCLVLTTKSLSAQSYKLPDYTTFKLANGLTIFLMEQHDVPVISVSALIPAGAINDKDKSGLASLSDGFKTWH